MTRAPFKTRESLGYLAVSRIKVVKPSQKEKIIRGISPPFFIYHIYI